MAITYPRDLPEGIEIVSSRIGLSFNQSSFEGFNRGVTVTSHGNGTGDRWEGLWTIQPKLNGSAGDRAMRAWFASLRGAEKTFKAYDPDCRKPQSYIDGGVTCDSTTVTCDSTTVTCDNRAFIGGGLVNGASQTGNSLVTDGWDVDGVATQILSAGDYIQVAQSGNDTFHVVTEDVTTDASGNATIPIEPALRTSPTNNGEVIINGAVMVARLVNPMTSIDSDNVKASYSFAWVEALT